MMIKRYVITVIYFDVLVTAVSHELQGISNNRLFDCLIKNMLRFTAKRKSNLCITKPWWWLADALAFCLKFFVKSLSMLVTVIPSFCICIPVMKCAVVLFCWSWEGHTLHGCNILITLKPNGSHSLLNYTKAPYFQGINSLPSFPE